MNEKSQRIGQVLRHFKEAPIPLLKIKSSHKSNRMKNYRNENGCHQKYEGFR